MEQVRRQREREAARWRQTMTNQTARIRELERKIGELELDLEMVRAGFGK